jgi:hypothetical protein
VTKDSSLFHRFLQGLHARRLRLYEFTGVTVWGAVLSSLILYRVLLAPGFIVVRDTTPIFYSEPAYWQLLSNPLANYITYIDAPYGLLALLLYGGLVSVQVFQRMLLFLFPFATGVVTMYYSSSYFLRRYTKPTRDPAGLGRLGRYYIELTSGAVATLYVLTPTALFYSFWFFAGAVYAFLPLSLALFDFGLVDSGRSRFSGVYWRGLAVAAGLTLLTTDPRGITFAGFVITGFTAFVLITGGLKVIRRVAAAIGIGAAAYLLLNVRVVVLGILLLRPYSSFESGIAASQLGSNFVFFPPLTSLAGLGLYIPFVSYSAVWIFSLPLVLFSCGYLLKKSPPRIAFFFLALYLSVIAIQSNLLSIASTAFATAETTPALSFLWLVFPMYFSELAICPLFLLFGFALADIIRRVDSDRPTPAPSHGARAERWVRRARTPSLVGLAAVVIGSQLIFSSPGLSSGDYAGTYAPIVPSPGLYQVAEKLTGSTGYNLIVGSDVAYPPAAVWNSTEAGYQLYLSLPNAIYSPVALDYPNLAPVLFQYGAENIVLNTYHPPFDLTPTLDYLEAQTGLTRSYSASPLYIFHNTLFRANLTAPGYLLAMNYPQSLLASAALASPDQPTLPFTGQSFDSAFVRGVVGYNITFTDLEALSIGDWELNLGGLGLLPPLNSYDPGRYWSMQLGYFPIQAPCLAVSSGTPQPLNLGSFAGTFDLFVENIVGPAVGGIQLSDGAWTDGINLTGRESVQWSMLPNVTLSGPLSIKNLGVGNLCDLALVPISQASSVVNATESFADSHSFFSLNPTSQIPGFLRNATATHVANGWLVSANQNHTASAVTYIVHPAGALFGNPYVLQSPDSILINRYSGTIYDYIVLGLNYTFASYGDTVEITVASNIVSVCGLAAISIHVLWRRKRSLRRLANSPTFSDK